MDIEKLIFMFQKSNDDIFLDWRWLIGNDIPLFYTIIGDAFLKNSNGNIMWLTPGDGKYNMIAENVEEFFQIISDLEYQISCIIISFFLEGYENIDIILTEFKYDISYEKINFYIKLRAYIGILFFQESKEKQGYLDEKMNNIYYKYNEIYNKYNINELCI